MLDSRSLAWLELYLPDNAENFFVVGDGDGDGDGDSDGEDPAAIDPGNFNCKTGLFEWLFVIKRLLADEERKLTIKRTKL